MDAGLIVHSTHPFTAEPPLARLAIAPRTSARDFYVRSHGAIPRLAAGSHRLSVTGLVRTKLDLSLAGLAGFPERRVLAVLQCAGNRRADLNAWRPTSGDPWSAGAIGNAEWAGVGLNDVLRAAGVASDAGLHVAFEAADIVELPNQPRFTFGTSIPLAKALAPEVLLAWAMNDERLAPEHGFPLRLIVPGFAGVRSVKWLRAIIVQDRPSENHMQQRDYKLLPPDITTPPVDWSRGMMIEEMPLNSAICAPQAGAVLPAGPVQLRGYAVAGGRAVARVDVSIDGGRNWLQASLRQDAQAPWSWTLWHCMADLAPGAHDLVARAWDSAGQTQPARPAELWNFKGYLGTAWHRVRVTAQ